MNGDIITNNVLCVWAKPVADYFNNETVKAALNVNPAYIKDPWIDCRFPGMYGFNFTKNETGSAWIYQALRGKGYKFLLYSGDTDSIYPTLGTQ